MALQNTLITVELATMLTAATVAGATPNYPLDYKQLLTMSSGTGSNQADKLWISTGRTLAASTAEDLDLAGTLTDVFGATITMARVKGLIIAASAANTNNVIVGNAASNGFISWVGAAAHTVTVRPGGVLALFAPDATAYTVTSGTGDLLHVANGAAGSAVTYDVAVIGASA
jgi:hypothetical protein